MYITGTAYTWKGEIDEAVFQFEADEFFKKLDEPNFSGKFGIEGAHPNQTHIFGKKLPQKLCEK